jgi:DNA-binding transcriptional ArsR family regulator
VLRDQRLVTGERRGREMAYRISDHHVLHIVDDAIRHTREPALDSERR